MRTSARDQILANGMNSLILTDDAIRGLEQALATLRRARSYGHAGNTIINRALFPGDTLSDLPDAA